MRRLFTMLILTFILVAIGANAYSQISTAAVLFLRIAAGARAAGMGEAFVAIADDATATHWNPAGLGQYPLSPKWFDIEIPVELRPLSKVALFEGAGGVDNFQKYDVWAISNKGLIKFDGQNWVDSDVVTTRRDQTLESVIRKYTGRIGTVDDQLIIELTARVAKENNKSSMEKIDSLNSIIKSFLDAGYSDADDLDSIFIKLKSAYNHCLIDWEKFYAAEKLISKAVRDSLINETEADRTLFVLDKAVLKYLPRELIIPFSINFEGKINDVSSTNDYLWVASESGLYRYNGRVWQHFGLSDGLPTLNINRIDIYRKKVFLCTDTGLVMYESGAFTHFGPDKGLPQKQAQVAVGTAKERIWAVVDNDLYFYDGAWRNYFEVDVKPSADIDSIYDRVSIYGTPREKDVFVEKFMALNPNFGDDSTESAIDTDSIGLTLDEINKAIDLIGFMPTIDILSDQSAKLNTALEKDITDSTLSKDTAEENITGVIDAVTQKKVKVPFTGGFEFEILDMEVDPNDNLWIGTENGLLKFLGHKWNRYGYRAYIPDKDISVFDIALEKVSGDSTRAERLAKNIKKTNRLESDEIKAGQKIMVYANPAGAAINDIQLDGAKIIFSTSSGTIVFDGIWQRYKERNLGKRYSIAAKEKNNNVWFVTRDRVEVIARTKVEITGMHVQLVPELADDIYYEFLGYVQNIEGWGTIGGNVTFLSYGKVLRTDTQGNSLGEFSPFELALTLSYGTQVSKKLSGGISAKLIYSHLSTIGAGAELGSGTSTGLAIDLGLLYRISERLTFGMALTNLGPEISYIDVAQSDPLPRNLAFGLAWKIIKSPYNQLLFTIDANKSLADREQTIVEDFRDVLASPQTELKGLLFNPFTLGNMSREFRNVIINTGIEYRYGQFIAFRGGYIHDEIGDIKTPTLGVGLAISVVNFDLAYIPTSDENPGVSNTMKISVSADW